MCERLGRCEYCAYDKDLCQEYGDGSPICGMFRCNVIKCERQCISFEEEMELYGEECW